MDKFLELVADTFDVDITAISMDKNFRTEIGNYSSMTGFALLVMIEDEYGIEISEEQFLECSTLADVYKLCVHS